MNLAYASAIITDPLEQPTKKVPKSQTQKMEVGDWRFP
jgi:hypothetical protein